MTVVAAVVDRGDVWMAADTSTYWLGGDAPEMYRPRGPEKVCQVGPYLVGFTGSWRILQALVRGELPGPEGEAYEHMCARFLPALRELLRDEHLNPQEWVKTPLSPAGVLMVAFAGRLFAVSADLAVLENPGEIAIGVGRPWAYGSLYSTRGQAPAERLRFAVQAAEEFCPGVRGPFIGYRLTAAGTVEGFDVSRRLCAV